MRPRALSLLVVASGSVLVLTGCSSAPHPPDALASYTDPGDGCQQTLSAISYAEGPLRDLGQEAYQEFTDDVRSRLSAVDGTVALEVRDYPSSAALRQARMAGTMAQAAAKAGVSRRVRVERLREYRVEAAKVVVVCTRALEARAS